MTLTANELLMLQSKPLRTGRFNCGHPKKPSNSYVISNDGRLYIRCLECHVIASRQYYERKKK
jgi:hypothetical protein